MKTTNKPVMVKAGVFTSQGILRWFILVCLGLCLILTIQGAWPGYSQTVQNTPLPVACVSIGKPSELVSDKESPFWAEYQIRTGCVLQDQKAPIGNISSTQKGSVEVLKDNGTYVIPGLKPVIIPGANPVKMMILTRYRSGSSFVGDLFSHHRDVYYMFEPLHLVSKLITDAGHSAIWLNKIAPYILNQTYGCNFERLYRDSLQMIGQRKHWKRAFCTKNVKTLEKGVSYYEQLCMKSDSSLVKSTADVCSSFKHTIIKTIRLRDANVIRNLTDNNVKVINLVRDPRGQMSSILAMEKLHLTHISNFRERTRNICNDLTRMFDTIERLLEETPELQDKYLLVRYEDIALNPETMTERMYQFAGLDLTDDVRNWIKQSTNETSRKKTVDTYGTMRNSSRVATAWTRKLKLSQVMTVQEVCGNVLQRLGYDIMWSENDLVNKNPILPFPRNNFLTRQNLRADP